MDEPRATTIAQLNQSGAFRELAAELHDAEERYWQGFTKRIRGLQPEQRIVETVDWNEVEFMRARFAAARIILKQPDRAARYLERGKEATNPDED